MQKTENNIEIGGAKNHNLKNVSVSICLDISLYVLAALKYGLTAVRSNTEPRGMTRIGTLSKLVIASSYKDKQGF